MKALSVIFAITLVCLFSTLQISLARDIHLATLNSTQGLKLLGTEPYSSFGTSVKSAGDINGDGIDDIIIGASFSDPKGRYAAGTVYVVYGSRKGFDGLDISNMSISRGFHIIGAAEKDGLGPVVSGAGDVNADGIDDLLVVASHAKYADGYALVIFGSKTSLSDIDLSLGLNSTQGFNISGATGNYSASSAGDVNADGIDDVIIGAFFTHPLGRYAAGTAYVVFGRRTGITDIDLTNLTSTEGITVIGANEGDTVGYVVSGAGDVNGDGIDDIVIGANNLAYVLYGSTRLSDIDLANFNKTQGFSVIGAGSGGFVRSVSEAGDVNGDFIDDIILGDTGDSRGRAYVLFGSFESVDTINVSNLTNTQGFYVVGIPPYDSLGTSVSGAGDVNGDGIDDIIIGDPAPSVGNGGRAYVIYGSRNVLPNIDLAYHLSDTQGSQIISVTKLDSLGTSVSGAGDFNGDGQNDIVIGDQYANNAAGAVYVIFSSAFQEITIEQ